MTMMRDALCSKAWNGHNYICTYFQHLQFTKTVCTSLAEPLVSTWILFLQGTADPMIKWLPTHVCAKALSLFFYICEEQHQKRYRSSESYNHRDQLLWWSKVEHDLDSTPTLGTSCKRINDILLVESEAVSDKGFDINATTANEVQTQWICVAVSENTKNVHFPVAHKVLKESGHKHKFIYPSTCYHQDILIHDMHSSQLILLATICLTIWKHPPTALNIVNADCGPPTNCRRGNLFTNNQNKPSMEKKCKKKQKQVIAIPSSLTFQLNLYLHRDQLTWKISVGNYRAAAGVRGTVISLWPMPTRQTRPPDRVALKAVFMLLLSPTQSIVTSMSAFICFFSARTSASTSCYKSTVLAHIMWCKKLHTLRFRSTFVVHIILKVGSPVDSKYNSSMGYRIVILSPKSETPYIFICG